MDEKLLKRTALNSFILMLVVVVLSVGISKYGQTLLYAGSNYMEDIWNLSQYQEGSFLSSLLGGDEEVSISASYEQILGDKYLIIKKPEKAIYDIDLKDLYMNRSIELTIKDIKNNSFDDTFIIRRNQGYEFWGQPAIAGEGAVSPSLGADKQTTQQQVISVVESSHKDTEEEKYLIPEVISATGEKSDFGVIPASIIVDPVKEFTIVYNKDTETTSQYAAVIHIVLDYIYAPILYQDNDFIYIDLRKPQEVYEKIVVIDPGHGGRDCGAYSKDEKYFEKDINLDIVLYLKEILDQEDMKVYYTRTTDETIFLNPRVNLANDVNADLFLSIHCNANESPVPRGTEILYNELQQGEGFLSSHLAEIALEEVVKVTHKVNRGLVFGSEMVIVGKSKVPMVLIEVGFMSNQEELEFLLKEENKRNLANSIFQTITRAIKELDK